MPLDPCKAYVIVPYELDLIATDAVNNTQHYSADINYIKGARVQQFGGIYEKLVTAVSPAEDKGNAPVNTLDIEGNTKYGYLPQYEQQTFVPEANNNRNPYNADSVEGTYLNTGEHTFTVLTINGVTANYWTGFTQGHLYRANKDTSTVPVYSVAPQTGLSDWDYVGAYASSITIPEWQDIDYPSGVIVWSADQQKAFVTTEVITADPNDIYKNLIPQIPTDQDLGDLWNYIGKVNSLALLDGNPDNQTCRKGSLSFVLSPKQDSTSFSFINMEAETLSIQVGASAPVYFNAENVTDLVVLDSEVSAGSEIKINLIAKDEDTNVKLGDVVFGEPRSFGYLLSGSGAGDVNTDTANLNGGFSLTGAIQQNKYVVFSELGDIDDEEQEYDRVTRLIIETTKKPSVYIGGTRFETLVMHGVRFGQFFNGIDGETGESKTTLIVEASGNFRQNSVFKVQSILSKSKTVTLPEVPSTPLYPASNLYPSNNLYPAQAVLYPEWTFTVSTSINGVDISNPWDTATNGVYPEYETALASAIAEVTS